MKYTIEVTQEDIDAGEVGDCFFCPIARAARRALGGHSVEVHADWLALRDGDGVTHASRVADMPGLARAFVLDFDEGGQAAVEPFTFEVELPNVDQPE